MDRPGKPGGQGARGRPRTDLARLEAIDAQRKRAEGLLQLERDLAVAIGAARGLDEALELVLDHALQLPGIDCGGVYLVDSDSGEVCLGPHRGLPPAFVERSTRYDKGTHQARMISAGEPIYGQFADLTPSQDQTHLAEGLRALAVVPIRHQGRVEAALNLASHTHEELPPGSCEAIEAIAAQVGAVISRVRADQALARLRDQLEELVRERTAELAEANRCLQAEIEERIRLEADRLRTQRLESVGELAGGIAHDFNNILQGILGNISLARMDLDPDQEAHRRLVEAERASARAQALTQQLLTFSQGGAPVTRPLDLAGRARDAAQLAAAGSSSRLEYHLPAELWSVDADAGQLGQLISNLVLNACQAMPEGGVIRIEGQNLVLEAQAGLPLPPGRYVKLTVADQGPGIAPDHAARIFDPYFSTKPDCSGLGLAVAHSVAVRHGGHLAVEAVPGQGAIFGLLLPAADQPVAHTAHQPTDLPAGRGRVLVMDDEPMVREIAQQMLAHVGYQVALAADGVEAIACFSQAQATKTPFDAVILDLTVPGGMGGKETIARLRELDPNVKAIVSSGYSHDAALADFDAHGFTGVLAKPYRATDLARVLFEVLHPASEPD